jgi:hypothetical protein
VVLLAVRFDGAPEFHGLLVGDDVHGVVSAYSASCPSGVALLGSGAKGTGAASGPGRRECGLRAPRRGSSTPVCGGFPMARRKASIGAARKASGEDLGKIPQCGGA